MVLTHTSELPNYAMLTSKAPIPVLAVPRWHSEVASSLSSATHHELAPRNIESRNQRAAGLLRRAGVGALRKLCDQNGKY